MLFTGSKRTGYFLNKNVNFGCLENELSHFSIITLCTDSTRLPLPLVMTLNIISKQKKAYVTRLFDWIHHV